MRFKTVFALTAVALAATASASLADSVGVYDPDSARWEILRSDGTTDVYYFGLPGDEPLSGDWDCDGADSAGMWRRSTGFAYLQDDEANTAVERTFFGGPGDIPLAGDWDGDGCDTLGVYRRTGRVVLTNAVGGAAEQDYWFGIPGDEPFVGDFDGDGRDEVGLHRDISGFVYLRYSRTTGIADSEFWYGVRDDHLVAGDWDRDGDDTVGVFRPTDEAFYLRNDNSLGFADEHIPAGDSASIPIAGRFTNAVRSAPTADRSFTIAASGDLLIHSAVRQAAAQYEEGPGYDFFPMFAPIEPLIGGADFAICHLEVPLTPTNTNLSSYPIFNAPHELADAIRQAGYDSCSVASNHTIDKGETGVRNTLGVLDAAGVQHAGAARGPEEDTPAIYDVDGVRVGHISYTYGLNGLSVPAGKDWLVNVTGVEQILADAAAAKAAGAEFVIVSMHWGVEYRVDPTGTQESQAESILSSPDVDLILGHHAHVIQPVGKVGDEYVIYGMGNFLSNQRSGNTRVGTEDGVLVQVHVAEVGGELRVTGIEYTPTYVEFGTYRILPVAETLNRGGLAPDLESALEVSWGRTLDRFNRLGTAGVSPTAWPRGIPLVR
jgi:poly-gamma-glutamate synthesis protein (capsule biosynthesis protein)